jgi:CBS domain-containing protein
MQVRQAMSRNVHTATPSESIRDAARDMVEADIGLLPVEENDRMIGMITDRDIAVRAVAEGLPPDTPVRQVMTSDVKYCFEDDEIEDVCRNMADIQVRRLPVVNRDKRLVGIVSLCDLASNGNARLAGEALQGISQPGGSHTQHV